MVASDTPLNMWEAPSLRTPSPWGKRGERGWVEKRERGKGPRGLEELVAENHHVVEEPTTVLATTIRAHTPA